MKQSAKVECQAQEQKARLRPQAAEQGGSGPGRLRCQQPGGRRLRLRSRLKKGAAGANGRNVSAGLGWGNGSVEHVQRARQARATTSIQDPAGDSACGN